MIRLRHRVAGYAVACGIYVVLVIAWGVASAYEALDERRQR